MTYLSVIQRIKIDTRRLVFAVAMTAISMSSAHATTTVEPKADVVLKENVLTVGDLFPEATENAGFVLAPAPAPGKTMTLYARDLQRVSNQFNLGWHAATSNVTQATIRRDAHLIDPMYLEQMVSGQITKQLPGQNFDVQLNETARHIYVPSELKPSIQVSNVHVDVTNGTFRGYITGDAGLKKEIAGRFFAMTRVPVLINAMRQGDIITQSDIDYIDVRSDTLSQNVIVNINNMIGQTPRRGVSALKPLTDSDIMLPEMIKKGEKVTMQLRHNSIQLTALGRAMENGAVGDIVRVMNMSSQQIIQGVVTGPRMVEVDIASASANKI